MAQGNRNHATNPRPVAPRERGSPIGISKITENSVYLGTGQEYVTTGMHYVTQGRAMNTGTQIDAPGFDRMIFGQQRDALPYTVESLQVFVSEVLIEVAAYRTGLVPRPPSNEEIGSYAKIRLPDLFDASVPERIAVAWGFIDTLHEGVEELHFDETELSVPPPPAFLLEWGQEFIHSYVQMSDIHEWPLVGAARFLRDRNLELEVRVDARVGDRGEVNYRTTWIPPEDEETEALLMKLAGTGRVMSLSERREGQTFRELTKLGTQQMVGAYHLIREYLRNLAGPTHS